MKKSEKITIMLLSGAFFVLGVVALSWEKGPARTWTLAVVFVGLGSIAILQTVRNRRKK